MKKHKLISLSIISLLLMAPAFIQADADAVMMADNAPAKKKSCSHNKSAEKRHQNRSGKECMRHIEKKLDQIRADFKSGKMNAEQANAALDKIPGKIKRAISKMKKEEEHGKMWQRHQHRLQEQLKAVRKFVNNGRKNNDKK